MRAVVCAGPGRVRVEDVPEPKIQDDTDSVVRVERASICASDLHLLDGKFPGMREGAVIGHEFVGVVTETGPASGLQAGERVLGSFLIACGACRACRARRFNHCANRRLLGLGTATGDLDGAQAEFVRVPDAAVNLKKLDGPFGALDYEQALFAGDILVAGFYAVALGGVSSGNVVAVVGSGPVGMFAAAAAAARGARVIVLDLDARRVEFARSEMGFEAHDVSATDPQVEIAGATNGAMADVAIEAVGSPAAVKSAMKCVRDGGVVVIAGVYGAERLDLHLGMSWVRGLDLRFTGMANVQAHWDEALETIAGGDLDPTRVITHRLPLDEAEKGYELFAAREAIKVVLEP